MKEILLTEKEIVFLVLYISMIKPVEMTKRGHLKISSC